MMEFIHSTTELTTAATDLLLAVAAFGCIYIVVHKLAVTGRIKCWLAIFSCLALAAVLGGIAHGLVLSAPFKELLWMTIYFSLALLVALFVVAVIYDVWGAVSAKRLLWPLMLAALGFFVYVTQFSTSFLPFIIYEAIAMFISLLGYAWLWRRGFAGAGWFTCGVLLTLIAAAIQATQALSFTLVWPFDHNSVYHLLQLLAVLLLLKGLLLSSEIRPASVLD